MVGSGMFNFLNLRLQQIMGSKEPFGGITVITVGDPAVQVETCF